MIACHVLVEDRCTTLKNTTARSTHQPRSNTSKDRPNPPSNRAKCLKITAPMNELCDEEGREKTDQRGHVCPLVAVLGVELDDEARLLRREGALLEVRPQVVGPPQPAALAAPQQRRAPVHRVPVPFPVPPHVLRQHLVLLRTPHPLLQNPPPPPLSSSSSAFPATTAVHRFGTFDQSIPACGTRLFYAFGYANAVLHIAGEEAFRSQEVDIADVFRSEQRLSSLLD